MFRNLLDLVKEDDDKKDRKKSRSKTPKYMKSTTIGPNQKQSVFYEKDHPENAKDKPKGSKETKSAVYDKNKCQSLTELADPSTPVNIVINNIIQVNPNENQGMDDYQNNMKGTYDPLSKGYISRTNSQLDVMHLQELEEHPYRHLLFSPEPGYSFSDFLDHLRMIKTGIEYSKASIKQPSLEKIEARTVDITSKKSKFY